MGLSAYETRLGNRLARQKFTPGAGYPEPGGSQEFTLAQSQRLDLSVTGFTVRSVGVTNLTPFFIHFPNNPAAFAWVLPNTLNAVIPVPPGDVVRLNSIDVPAGLSVQSGSSLTASITAFEDSLPPNPGIPFNASPNLVPNKSPINFLNAGIIVPAVAGQTCYLFGCLFSVLVAAAGGALQLQDTAGTIYVAIASDVLSVIPVEFDGAPLPIGLGVKVVLVGAPSTRVMITYSQA